MVMLYAGREVRVWLQSEISVNPGSDLRFDLRDEGVEIPFQFVTLSGSHKDLTNRFLAFGPVHSAQESMFVPGSHKNCFTVTAPSGL